MEPSLNKILCIEVNRDMYVLMSCLLGFEGFVVISAQTSADGLEILRRHSIRLIIINLNMPDGSSINFIRQIRARDITIPILVHTAATLMNELDQAIEAGANDYLLTPDGWNNLIPIVNYFCNRAISDVAHS